MSNRTIEIDLDDYIDMLEMRKAEVAEYHNWTIPDGVWAYFLELLEDCGISGDNRPAHVIDNIAVNGSYGPIENYELLDTMVQSIIEDAACEGITLDKDTAKDQLMDISLDGLRDIAEAADDGTALFFYDEPNSDYGLGVCYWLL